MKKKIGILTLPLSNNYGGIIQAAALYYFIEGEGYFPYLIRREKNSSKTRALLKFLFSINPLSFIFDPNDLHKRYCQDRQMRSFISSFFVNRSKKLYSNNALIENSNNIDGFIVGSDQVWRYEYVKDFYKNFFLDFVEEKKIKISYAASFGVDKWEGDEKSKLEIKKLLKNFHSISVRESHGVKYCDQELDVLAANTLDPTLLVDVNFYHTIINSKSINKDIELFNYVLDQKPEKQEFVNTVGKMLNCKIQVIDLYSDSYQEKPSISDWLSNIFHAKFIVTDSFHGMVFSIIFNKPFIVIANKNRGLSRFESLLSQLGLIDRLIIDFDTSNSQSMNELICQEIDYKNVNAKLSKLRAESRSFLVNSLNAI